MRLSELLVRENLIDLERLRKARRTGRGLARAVVELGYIGDAALRDTVARFYELPALNLDDVTIDDALFQLMPRELCLKHRVLPVERRERTLVVAMTDPSDTFAIDDIRFLTGCGVEMAIASPNAMERALVRVAAAREEDLAAMSAFDLDAVAGSDSVASDSAASESAASESAVAKLAGVLLCDMERKRANEAILEPRPQSCTVWFRIDGTLTEVAHISASVRPALEARLRALMTADGSIHLELGVDGIGEASPSRPRDRVVAQQRLLPRGARSLDYAVAFNPSAFGTQATLMLLSRPYALAADDDVAVRVHRALRGFADAARFDPAADGVVHVSLKRRRDGAWLPAWTYAAQRHASVAAHLALSGALDLHTDAGEHGPRLLARKAIPA